MEEARAKRIADQKRAEAERMRQMLDERDAIKQAKEDADKVCSEDVAGQDKGEGAGQGRGQTK